MTKKIKPSTPDPEQVEFDNLPFRERVDRIKKTLVGFIDSRSEPAEKTVAVPKPVGWPPIGWPEAQFALHKMIDFLDDNRAGLIDDRKTIESIEWIFTNVLRAHLGTVKKSRQKRLSDR